MKIYKKNQFDRLLDLCFLQEVTKVFRIAQPRIFPISKVLFRDYSLDWRRGCQLLHSLKVIALVGSSSAGGNLTSLVGSDLTLGHELNNSVASSDMLKQKNALSSKLATGRVKGISSQNLSRVFFVGTPRKACWYLLSTNKITPQTQKSRYIFRRSGFRNPWWDRWTCVLT